MRHCLAPAGLLLVVTTSACLDSTNAIGDSGSGDDFSRFIQEHDGPEIGSSLDEICTRVDESDWLLSQLARLEDPPLEKPERLYSLGDLPVQEREIFLMLNDLTAIPAHRYGTLPERWDCYVPLKELARFCVNFTTMEDEIVEGMSHACLILNERGRPQDQMIAFAIRYLMPQIPKPSNAAIFWILARGLDYYARDNGYYLSSPVEREIYVEVSHAFMSGTMDSADDQKWADFMKQVRQKYSSVEDVAPLIHTAIFHDRYLQHIQSACGH